MNDFYNKYKKNINFIGFINFSGDKNKQRRIIEGTGIDFKINTDKNYERWERLGIKHFPAKLIVDKKGKIIFADSTLYLPNSKRGELKIKFFDEFLKRMVNKKLEE